jgi:Spy/CpxP family protein refolding chaperone
MRRATFPRKGIIMATTTPPNAPAPGSNNTCPHCHCDPASANLGQQLMQHITQLTPTERTQMLALIDRILSESNQQSQSKTTNKAKRNKKH